MTQGNISKLQGHQNRSNMQWDGGAIPTVNMWMQLIWKPSENCQLKRYDTQHLVM